MSKPRGAKRLPDQTVHPGVYERGIGTPQPYFQVRIRHRGEKERVERFPYVPAGWVDKDGTVRKGVKRDAALNQAIAQKAKDASQFHYYGKPQSRVADEYTLRQWIEGWATEACEFVDITTGATITDLPERKGAEEDAKQIRRLVRIADEYAIKNKRASMMDRRVVELNKGDFNGPHWLLKMLTGRKRRAPDGTVPTMKPPASAATKRRALALLGAVWNHARDHWNMDIPRPWAGVVVRKEEHAATGRALTVAEYEAVSAALGLVHKNTLAALHFLRWTAARAGEMRKLRWEHIGWTPGREMVKFVGTKTPRQGAYRERVVPLNEGALAALATMYDKALGPPKSGVVFPSPTNPKAPISRHTAYQAWVRAIRRAKVPHARLHDLRHTRTTELSEALTKAQAMVITGHSDERTFTRYTHLAESTAKKIAEADAKRAVRAKGTATVQPSALLEMLKDMELSAEERMQAISMLATK